MCCNLPTHNFYYFAGKISVKKGFKFQCIIQTNCVLLGCTRNFLSLKFLFAHSWVGTWFPNVPCQLLLHGFMSFLRVFGWALRCCILPLPPRMWVVRRKACWEDFASMAKQSTVFLNCNDCLGLKERIVLFEQQPMNDLAQSFECQLIGRTSVTSYCP
jgi:hypothetical protein